ncbi:MAG: hypothetical protein U1E65_20160 [Myxococcota bacterium]
MRRALPLLLLTACSSTPAETPFTPRATLAPVAADPLLAGGHESCPIYLEERCMAGQRQRCEIVDGASGTLVSTPDPVLRRAFLYDRWYDKFMSPLGLTMERVFTTSIAPGASDAEWGAPERFSRWAGEGDSAIWTGTALMADIYRYAETHTEADYRRMEDRARALVLDFEVTGIPGYLARSHFLLVPPGSPKSDQLILHYGDESTLTSIQLELPSLDLPGLPAEYKAGLDDGQGGKIHGKAYWEGDVSIDQYTGPMTAFPILWNLLRDEQLKSRIAFHMGCYLKRLQRIEIINLKARPTLVQDVLNAFGGSRIRLDPGDPNLQDLESLVWYVHPGINRQNAATFVGTCPNQVQLTPTRVIDAQSEHFELDLLNLNADINRDNRTLPNQIDHFYIPTIRGGDASHLMHLAAMLYYFTGEEQYRSFLFDELIGHLRADEVAKTMMAFRLPDWCFRFYGDHITYGTHWQLVNLLPEGKLRDAMIEVEQQEIWEKAMFNQRNAKASLLYASIVPEAMAAGRARALDDVRTQLRGFGGNGGVLDAPRRQYSHDPADVIAAFPAGTTVRCPSPDDRAFCEDSKTLLGFPLEGDKISHDCDGRAGECQMPDGKCTDGLASDGLPIGLRPYEDFVWQRNPFSLGERYGLEGQVQSPGRDFGEEYWMARHYGYLTEGQGQVLGWTPAGSCP